MIINYSMTNNKEIKSHYAELRSEIQSISYSGALDSIEHRSKSFAKRFDDPSIKNSLKKKAYQEHSKTLKALAKRRKQLK